MVCSIILIFPSCSNYLYKGTTCFIFGIFLVIAGWAFIGLIVEVFGFINLFGYVHFFLLLLLLPFFFCLMPNRLHNDARKKKKKKIPTDEDE